MVLVVTVVTTVALGGTFAGVSYTFNQQQRRELDEELLQIARDEAREAPTLLFSFTDGPGPAANDVGPLTKHGIIFDERGQVLAATPPFDQAPPSRSQFPSQHRVCFDFSWQKLHLRGVLVPIPGFPGRELLLAASREDLDGDKHSLNRAMQVAFLAALIWVVAVAHWASGRLMREHERITRVAREVARGDLSARVAISSKDQEIVQLGHDIDEMIDRLEQLLAARDRLVMHAAHELRSPLTKLYGELQLALRKERDATSYRQAIERALPAARRLSLLVDDLLLLARLRGEQPELEQINLASCVAEAVALVQEEALARGVSLDIQVRDLLLPGRARDLTRLLRNLIENAIAHAPEGSTVQVQLETSGPQPWVDVIDQGPGVAPGEEERIFEPFFRSRAGRVSPDRGSGLGLGIARDIARSLGGDVVLQPPRQGEGARFRLLLHAPQADPPTPGLL
jgi:signal transduction histidine kinase